MKLDFDIFLKLWSQFVNHLDGKNNMLGLQERFYPACSYYIWIQTVLCENVSDMVMCLVFCLFFVILSSLIYHTCVLRFYTQTHNVIGYSLLIANIQLDMHTYIVELEYVFWQCTFLIQVWWVALPTVTKRWQHAQTVSLWCFLTTWQLLSQTACRRIIWFDTSILD